MNLFMGGSVHWWKTKHNQHHATPNRITEGSMHLSVSVGTGVGYWFCLQLCVFSGSTLC